MLSPLFHHLVGRLAIHAAPTVIREPIAGDTVPACAALQKPELQKTTDSDCAESRGKLVWNLERSEMELKVIHQLPLPRGEHVTHASFNPKIVLIASGLDGPGGGWRAIQASSSASWSGCRRTLTEVPTPVGAGPRRFFGATVS